MTTPRSCPKTGRLVMPKECDRRQEVSRREILHGGSPFCCDCSEFRLIDPTAPIIVSGPKSKEETMSNKAPNPYKQGVCKICGVERKIFTKSETCQSCNMKAKGNYPPPPLKTKDAPPAPKPDKPASRGEIITLNLSEVPGLADVIRKEALEELRSPENLALVVLRDSLMPRKKEIGQ